MMNIDSDDFKSDNILPEKELAEILDNLRKDGKKIGLCTGSFDLLHPEHITHFNNAKKVCDILVVAVAFDSFSSKKKPGSGRPVFSENLRAFMISQLKPVDFVILHDGSAGIINIVKPDVYIKGADYAHGKDAVVNQQIEMMKSYGGKMHYTEGMQKITTTNIIKYIKEETS